MVFSSFNDSVRNGFINLQRKYYDNGGSDPLSTTHVNIFILEKLSRKSSLFFKFSKIYIIYDIYLLTHDD